MTNIAPSIPRLRDLSNTPKQLYYRGTWDEKLFTKCAAVVGSRRMTQYGRSVIEILVPQLVNSGYTIISGFMYGADQAAHRETLAAGGRTIAVLGWGINWSGMDDEDRKLLKEIEARGLTLSEWDEQKPTLWTFPLRNRIVAALANEVYIVEAAAKSGALITASIAMRLKRPIWAVPGPITSKVSEGTNRLIAGGAARMWMPRENLEMQKARSDDPIVQELSLEPMDASEIARKLKRAIDEVGAQLSLLVLSGDIVEREGRYYAREG